MCIMAFNCFMVKSHTRYCGTHMGELIISGHAAAQLVEALRYKQEGRGFDTRWGNWDFAWT
jgi:hypothetical protein